MMKTEWDYTNLADAYLKRPDYAQEAIDRMLSTAGVHEGDAVCDVGAGAAHLTRMLAAKGLDVYAVEPNDAMRANGIKRTESFPNVRWFDGVGEHTGQPDNKFKLVSFGSSFNVTDRLKALQEAQRILAEDGWFACMWNHRDLEDPVQKKIERIIKGHIEEYSYGTRREDQTDVIRESGRFEDIQAFAGCVTHSVKVEDVVEAWRSHSTVERQARDKFDAIIHDIEDYIYGLNVTEIKIPYVTRVWMARVKKAVRGGYLLDYNAFKIRKFPVYLYNNERIRKGAC